MSNLSDLFFFGSFYSSAVYLTHAHKQPYVSRSKKQKQQSKQVIANS
jgi:hypothetical protein